uniref:CAA30378.1 protein n=1 Tax=Oryza sativa TaxID=4530 RepID=Q9ST89_ORYSA|nr:CAA30378.1 protein [Oryza sativa]
MAMPMPMRRSDGREAAEIARLRVRGFAIRGLVRLRLDLIRTGNNKFNVYLLFYSKRLLYELGVPSTWKSSEHQLSSEAIKSCRLTQANMEGGPCHSSFNGCGMEAWMRGMTFRLLCLPSS